MIDHLSTYATDFDASKNFYLAVLLVLGYEPQEEMVLPDDVDLPGRRAIAFGPSGRPIFWIIEVQEAASPRHMAFTAVDRKSVAEFHSAGLLAGGQDFGEPGLRSIYHEHYYGSFLLDPDGNNVEAVCHSPESWSVAIERQQIFDLAGEIPEGRVATYGQLALILGFPRGARQVGYALASLPDDTEVPWHRVINAKGEISPRGRPGAEDYQRILLEHEGVQFDQRGRCSLTTYRWHAPESRYQVSGNLDWDCCG
jgi:alkylated DNA nucleotide flippase Atl1/catechol 2,3-dioxygenase-like lactoylglutathione lyase family enzyme